MSRTRSTHDSAFTLMEVVLSTLLVGVVAVAALNSLGAATSASLDSSQRSRALAIATELMAEILRQPYLDADGSPAFGVETGESAATRADFDDIDDYDGWTASPPQDKTGSALAGMTNWIRSVVVVHVDPADLTTTMVDAVDSGMKMVTISVQYDGKTMATLGAHASSAWPPVEE